MGETTDGLRLAATTLTVAPVRGPRTVGRRAAGVAMGVAPLVGLVLGLVAAGVVYLARRAIGVDAFPPPTLLPAVVGIALLALLTRGLHLDGLIDTTDGLASYKPAPEARRIMRESSVGALGVAAVVLVLLLQVSALSQAITIHHGTAALTVACVASRTSMTLACRRGVRAADDTGLGATVAGTVPRPVALAWVAGAVGIAALSAQLDHHTLDRSFETVQACAAVAVALLGTEVLRRHCDRRLGGLSGDVLGAVGEVGLTLALLVMSVSPHHGCCRGY